MYVYTEMIPATGGVVTGDVVSLCILTNNTVQVEACSSNPDGYAEPDMRIWREGKTIYLQIEGQEDVITGTIGDSPAAGQTNPYVNDVPKSIRMWQEVRYGGTEETHMFHITFDCDRKITKEVSGHVVIYEQVQKGTDLARIYLACLQIGNGSGQTLFTGEADNGGGEIGAKADILVADVKPFIPVEEDEVDIAQADVAVAVEEPDEAVIDEE